MCKLSNEILFEIFDYLTFPDKQVCIRVCKKWRHLMLGYNYYEKLDIKYLDFLNKYFQKNESRRNQVQCLRVWFHRTSVSYNFNGADGVLALPEQFPHLREFVLDHASEDTNDSDFDELVIDKRVAEHWQKVTKFYNYFEKYCLSSKLLEHDGFLNLVDLKVKFWEGEFARRSESKCVALIKQISKAPKLEILKLSHGKMSQGHLDHLNRNAKKLQVLWLVDMDLASTNVNRASQTNSSSDILTELRLFNCTKEFNESMLKIMEYPNLKMLKVYSTKLQEKYGEGELIKFVSCCQYLKNYNVNIHPITPAIMKAMDTRGIKLEELAIMSLPDADHPDQIKSLLASEQKDSVLKLELSYSDDCEKKEIKVGKTIDSLKDFPKLEQLKMIGNKTCSIDSLPRFPVDEFLKTCENLKTLELQYWKTKIGSKLVKPMSFLRSEKKFTAKLKSLVLVGVEYCDKSMGFISETCPELSKLTITITSQHRARYCCDIDFPNHSFTSITVNNLRSCYYQVTKEKETKWYKFAYQTIEEVAEDKLSELEREDTKLHFLKYKSCAVLKLEGTRDIWV
ncbi:hypothetical protein [Parasitella parasitica]|uniref:F-box domain-containing protein n=1 Tax=Parasitella parasitica TaxID=35722 RepID=A0A0B7NPZ1_9FUNG|nr:hypothetical protein [Parasitella parasitica]